MLRLLPFVAFLGCGSTYTQTIEHGGSASLSLTPVTAGTGISVDVDLPGLTQEMVDAVPRKEGAFDIACPPPYLTYATDTGTGEPVYAVLLMCADSVDLGGSCPGPVTFSLELDGDSGFTFLSMDPIGDDTPAGDQFWIDGTVSLADPMLATSGSLDGVLTVDNGCMTEPVDHNLAIEWDFPLTSTVKTRTPFDWSFDLQ
ncbi:MAG: hypothetical protein AB8H79_12245 [Myxococcota bacterium]